MRYIWYMFISLVLLACASLEETATSTTTSGSGPSTSSGHGGSGGSAGSGTGGTGPSTGSGQATSASSGQGGSGQAGSGGQGGAPAEFFSCADVDANHFVLQVRTDFSPPGHTAGDGWIDYPDASGFQDVAWSVLFIEEDADQDEVSKDFGATPPGTRFEINLGMSLDGTADLNDPNDHAVDAGTYLCDNSTCVSADVLCCYGSSELGRVEGGVTSGSLAFDLTGHNVVCVTE